MKEKRKGNHLKTVLIVLIIVLISLISFVGIYIQDKNRMANIIPDYIIGTDVEGYRVVSLNVDNSTKDIIKDADGNVIESATDEEITEKGYTKTTEPINKPENLTTQNYEKSKEIIQQRLEELQVSDYKVRQNPEYGNIVIELKEDLNTDNIISSLTSVGKFEIQNNDTKEVLITNQDIEDVSVLYNNTTTGTDIYLGIEFNKEGTKKLEDITRTYIKSTDQDGNETEKKINMLLDGNSILTTSFTEPIVDGKLQLSVGSGSASSSNLSQYIAQATNMAVLLNHESMPITYTMESNKFIQSAINTQVVKIIVIAVAIIIGISLIVMMILYRKRGIFAAISHIGLTAVILLILRYTNVEIGIGGIIGLAFIQVMNYLLLMLILKKTKNNKKENTDFKATLIQFCFVMIPAYIVAIVFSFTTFLPIYSFGMVVFWGITLIVLYNLVITKNLLIHAKEE